MGMNAERPMDAGSVVRARVLAVIEQALVADLPVGWQKLEAPRSRRREAAAVLLRLAERPSLAQMQRAAAEAAARAREKRHDPKAGETRFWETLETLLTHLGAARREPPASLAELALWNDGPVRGPIDRAESALGGVADGPGAPDQRTLTALARLVLRAKARRWLVEAREAERPEPRREETAP